MKKKAKKVQILPPTEYQKEQQKEVRQIRESKFARDREELPLPPKKRRRRR